MSSQNLTAESKWNSRVYSYTYMHTNTHNGASNLRRFQQQTDTPKSKNGKMACRLAHALAQMIP